MSGVGCVESSTTHRNSWPLADGHSEETRFDRVVVDNNFPDGYQVEVAIAYDFEMNEPTRGKLALAIQGSVSDESWKLVHIADVGSIHRLRWGDIDGDRKLDLVVAWSRGEAAPL